MPNPQILRLQPGSEAAKQHGCICTYDEKTETSYIRETCPVHWPLVMVQSNMATAKHVKESTKYSNNMHRGLILIGIVMILILLFK